MPRFVGALPALSNGMMIEELLKALLVLPYRKKCSAFQVCALGCVATRARTK
jgi:hypothetical protein